MLTTEQIDRNKVLEEAANHLDAQAGEMLNPGPLMHMCANSIRKLKTCEKCGNPMSDSWNGYQWVAHNC